VENHEHADDLIFFIASGGGGPGAARKRPEEILEVSGLSSVVDSLTLLLSASVIFILVHHRFSSMQGWHALTRMRVILEVMWYISGD
jgi:hypothetical protein